MIRFIVLIVFILLITGCASTTKEMQEVIVDKRNKKEYVFPDDKYLEECKELPLLKGKKAKDLYLWGIDAATLYDKCATEKEVLSDWIKRFKEETNSK